MGSFYYFGHVKGNQPALGDEFYSKVLPVMFISALIWFGTCLYFGGYLWAPAYDYALLSMDKIVVYLIVYVVAWFLLLIFCFLRVNVIAAGLFFVISGITGFFMGLLLMYVSESLTLEVARSLFLTSTLLALGASAAAMSLGLALKDRIAKHYCLIFMLFGLFYTIFEVLMIVIFGYNNLIIDLLMFGYIFAVMVFDTATLPGKIQRGYWMMAAVDLFFDFVTMLIRIFILLVASSGRSRR